MSARGFQKVQLSAGNVRVFSRMWPGSNLPLVPITFEFVVNQNGTLGDLVDVNFQSLNEEQDRALAAMAEDAKAGRCGRLVQP